MSTYHLLTGSYSSPEEQGIKLWSFDDRQGMLTELAGIGGIDRPSFLAIHPNGKNFVATSEIGGADLVAYQFDRDANALVEVNRQSANGDHPAHVCIDSSGSWLLSVNYSGGNVNVHRLHTDGSIGERTDSIKHEGNGPNQERQDAPHPHSVFQLPGSDKFLVSDLGTDGIYVYELNMAEGKLKQVQIVQAPRGAGPRHLAFHPTLNFLYSLEEISSSLTVYSIEESGIFNAIQRVSLLPEEFSGKNTSAEVRISADGRYLYASNRGHDSLAVFTVQQDGKLELKGFTPCGGAGPRHFEMISEGRWIIAANEQSDTLTVLEVGTDGIPEITGKPVQTKAPVCVRVIA